MSCLVTMLGKTLRSYRESHGRPRSSPRRLETRQLILVSAYRSGGQSLVHRFCWPTARFGPTPSGQTVSYLAGPYFVARRICTIRSSTSRGVRFGLCLAVDDLWRLAFMIGLDRKPPQLGFHQSHEATDIACRVKVAECV